MAKKNKTAADIYREEMSEVTQPKSVVEGSRPLDNIKITPEEDESIVPTGGGAFDPSKWGISTDTDNMGGTIKTNRAAATIVDNDESEDNDPLKFLTDMANNLWTKEDEEAAAKKQKAAQWITAAQMLGDSIGALSNVYWTGKGANAMKFEPGAQKAAAATYQLEQDIRNAREKAAKAQYDATLMKYQLEMQRQDKKQAQENWQKTYDANEKWRKQQQQNWVTGNAQSQTQQAIANALSERGMKVQEQQAKTAATREYRLGKDENKPEMFLLGEGWVSVPKEKWTDTEVAAVYAKIPKEIRESIEKVITEKGEGYTKESTSKSIKPTPQQMRQWIGEYKHLPEVANAIRRLAGVKVDEDAAPKTEAPKGVVEKDAHGNEYSVNPDLPVLGAAPSSMQTDEAKKHLEGIVISTGKKPVWQ